MLSSGTCLAVSRIYAIEHLPVPAVRYVSCKHATSDRPSQGTLTISVAVTSNSINALSTPTESLAGRSCSRLLSFSD